MDSAEEVHVYHRIYEKKSCSKLFGDDHTGSGINTFNVIISVSQKKLPRRMRQTFIVFVL